MDGRELGFQHLSRCSGEISTSKETLCDKCIAISWDPHDFLFDLDHHETLSDLEASCKAGCPLCQTFFLLLTYDSLVSTKGDPLHWTLRSDFSGWSLLFQRPKGNPSQVWNMHEAGRHFPSQAVTTVKGFTPSGLTDDLCALLDESINPWLEACLCPGAHTNCPNLLPNEETSYLMPTRLIDVGSGRKPTVKLINSADLSEDDRRSLYLVLSYQWGKGNDSARTTTKNLEQRKGEIKIQSMPKTIRDAMDITRLMGIQYLWVDAVCIIQADKSLSLQQEDDVAKADWEKESMNMATYYSNALCCIAAASAKDSSEGFLTERQVARYGHKEWHSPANTFFPSPHAVRRRFRSSLLSRGWCLQEWLLSPRILHWTSNGLIWQCSHGFFWEGQSGFQGEPLGVFAYDHSIRHTNDCILDLGFSDKDTAGLCQILQCDERDIVGQTWTSLVCHFVRMDLSFSTDRLAAIQGISTRLSKRHGLEYFAGVFRPQCVEHLLWKSEYPPASAETVGSFPTWSWASSQGDIQFFESSGAWASLISDLQPFPSAEKQANVLRPANKELRFTAPLVRLSDLELTESDEASDIWPGRSQYVGRPGSRVWDGLSCTIHIDNLATPLPSTDRAHLLALRHFYYEYQGLVVQKVKNEDRVDPRNNTNVYERIGIFSMVDWRGVVANIPGLKTKIIII